MFNIMFKQQVLPNILCARVPCYTYASYEEYACMLGFLNFRVTMATDTGRTDTNLPKCSQKCELVFKGVATWQL
jgi:hypothetical protein